VSLVSLEEQTKAARDARKVTDKLYQTIKESPDRLSLSVLNSAVLVLLNNQITIMKSLNDLASTLKNNSENQEPRLTIKVKKTQSEEKSPTVEAKEKPESVEDIGTESDLELLDDDLVDDTKEEDGPSEPIHAPIDKAPEFQARVAIRSFDKRDNDFDKGIMLLNSWVSGETGTPFQIRKDPNYAYLNVTGLSQEKIDERAAQINKFFGFSQLLGEMSWEGLDGEIWLYTT
jgi:hypothetical protein